MLSLLAKRTGYTVLLALICSLGVFLLFDLTKDQAAVARLGPLATPEQVQLWLQQNGYAQPVMQRYGHWLAGAAHGDLGASDLFRVPVNEVLWPRLGNSLILLFFFFLIMTPIAIALGVLAGMREGSRLDHLISVLSVITTSTPSFVTAIVLSAIFVFWLHWAPGVSAGFDGFRLSELVLPVTVLVLGDVGYIARLTRGSVAEVMAAPYIRAAILKGMPFRRVVTRHALRNALVAPFTAIMLQVNWAVGGLAVVEAAFAYKGIGSLLVIAAATKDLNLEVGCVILVVVATSLTQVVADLGYRVLMPMAPAT
jgi:peptide/nickel transport system permease protein